MAIEVSVDGAYIISQLDSIIMDIAVNGPHPLCEIAPRAPPLLKFLEIIPCYNDL